MNELAPKSQPLEPCPRYVRSLSRGATCADKSVAWNKAKAALLVFLKRSDPAQIEDAAEDYYRCYEHHPPDAFKNCGHKRDRDSQKAFDNGEGWACRLASDRNLARYNLKGSHLALPEECVTVQSMSTELVAVWKAAIASAFPVAPLHWTLELGESSKVHAHVITDVNGGLPGLKRGGKVVETDLTLEQLVDYAMKPNFLYNPRNLAIFQRTKQAYGRVPRMSGTMHLPNRHSFHRN